MKLQTQIPLKQAENQIDYDSQILILGSCFAENIGAKLNYFKFQTVQNPFGVLFHPLAIEKLVSKAVRKERYLDDDVFFLNELWHCFDAHSDLSDVSKEKLLEKLNTALEKTYQQIIKSTHVIITLGTAWVYRKTTVNAIVANCHKVPQKEFSKELLSSTAIQKSLENTIENIQSLNKNIQFIFTVSPVRHLKDGFSENQRSKAHLITAIHEFLNTSNLQFCMSYFESYELMMDELRDYRFYKTDMVHPNDLAINYIWEKFIEVWVKEVAYSTMKQISVIQKGLQHRPFNSNSEKHQNFLKSLQEKITYIKQEYAFINFYK